VHGAIDCTHVHISKPALFPKDYYYFKTRGHSIVAQAVVDANFFFVASLLVSPVS
jgi:hypothetical protein